MEKENAKLKKRLEMKFPKFNPNLATLDLDPPNIFATSSKTKKTFQLTQSSLPHSQPVDSQLLHNFLNKIRNLFDVVLFEVKFCVYFLLLLIEE